MSEPRARGGINLVIITTKINNLNEQVEINEIEKKNLEIEKKDNEENEDLKTGALSPPNFKTMTTLTLEENTQTGGITLVN